MSAVPDPTDAKADGQFAGADNPKLERALDWARKGFTLKADEARLLAAEVDRLREIAEKWKTACNVVHEYVLEQGIGRSGDDIFRILIDDHREARLTPFARVAEEIAGINLANGWEGLKPRDWPIGGEPNYDKIGMKLALVHSEVSEATEEVRKGTLEQFAEELADVIIRTLDISYGLRLPIDGYVFAKMRKNRTRGFKHGGKRV